MVAKVEHAPRLCICCGNVTELSVQLSEGLNRPPVMVTRYYLSTDRLRKQSDIVPDTVREIPFCQRCLDRIDDSMRATILYLQAENGVVAIGSII